MTPFPSIFACATCLPDPGSAASLAQGNAILFMLAVLFSVLAVFIYTIISFGRKEKRVLAMAAVSASQN